MNKHPYKTTVPVFLMFFIRPHTLEKSFASVKESRPKTLFLVSDAPRQNHPTDAINNEICKKIVENIDWDCEVQKIYAPENFGMHKMLKYAFDIAFTKVDRFIFLEDDIVPNQSFYPFCEELLEKYKDDKRVHWICGMNNQEVTKGISSDYFFSRTGSIWGFAIWKRTFESLDYKASFAENHKAIQKLENEWHPNVIDICKANATSAKEKFDRGEVIPFEILNGISQILNDSLSIVPTKNLISCIGVGAGATHATDHYLKMPKSIRRLFFMNTYELDFPIKHPSIIEDYPPYFHYTHTKVFRSKTRRFLVRLEGKLRSLFFPLIQKFTIND